MVMRKNAMAKNLRQAILRSFGRYIALLLIIALGSGLFIGLLMAKSDIVATGQIFMDQQNMYDLSLLTMYGWSEEHIEEVARQEGILDAEGVIYTDFLARLGEEDKDSSYRFYEMPKSINMPYLRSGRMPAAENECVIVSPSSNLIGQKVVVQPSNGEDALETIRVKEFTIVGCIASPLLIDMTKTTGDGSTSGFIYVLQGILDLGYIPEIHVTLDGENTIYTDRYKEAMKASSKALEPSLEILAEDRLQQATQQAQELYQEGAQKLEDAWAEYHSKKLEADQEIQKAHQQLLDAEQEIAANEQKLIDGEEELENARIRLRKAKLQLTQGIQELENAKATADQEYANAEAELLSRQSSLSADLAAVEATLAPIDAELSSVNAEIGTIEAAAAPIDSQITAVNAQIAAANAAITSAQSALDALGEEGDPAEKAALQAQIAQQQALIVGYSAELAALQQQRLQYTEQLTPLYARRTELEAQRVGIAAQQAQISQELAYINQGIDALPSVRERIDQEIAAREAQLKEAAEDITTGYTQLAEGRAELENGKVELENAKVELQEAWEEFEKTKAEVDAEFQDALAELEAAEEELAKAKDRLDAMVINRSTILDRDSNAGYANLKNSANILQGISRVFPVFFLLIAALVCITTMTRMIDEERTEIGTLKALGYNNDEIIRKYLYYSGSSALIGCILGILAGNTIFPMLLWKAYNVSFCMQPRVVLTINLFLCIAVAVVYITILLLITWYCCRRTLQEVPAELIRPKAPDAGKALLVERLPFWDKLGFLNKVMIRNIFRYRQRLAMMLVGIGGCTALLLTGFGMQDSLLSIVDVQFEEVTVYDMSVYFQDALTEESKEKFLKDTEKYVDKVAFYHQSTVNLLSQDNIREIYMISTNEPLTDFINMHSGKKPVDVPGFNEAVLTVGTAQEMGLAIGDTFVLRNADLQEMTLTVSGIFDNHVYNYVIVAPETIEQQWEITPEQQMAFVTIPEDVAAYTVRDKISSLGGVMNVSVSEEQAALVESLLGAIEMVVVMVVVCAGMLAVIVLYNLTNININERIREIATIKVLGFNASETGAYVFKENMTLTIAGSFFGLGLGWLLLDFVISQIKVDTICFKPLLTIPSYVWAVGLTILSAIVVDFIFYFKLQKINMAEALKSVE